MQNISSRGCLCLSLCLIFFTLTVNSLADEPNLMTRPVPKDGGPTPVYIAMAMLDIDEINSADQNFTANLFISARWDDPRLAHDQEGDVVYPMAEVWHPSLQFVNQQKIWPTLPFIVRVSPAGEVEYVQRIWGPFSQPLDVRDFPFDSQNFDVIVASVGYGPNKIKFEVDPDTPSGIVPAFSLPDWEVTEWNFSFEPYQPLSLKKGSAGFSFSIQAKRYVMPYIFKVVLPLILIVAMSWIVFWVHPKESGTQIGVATTSMLTLIAYRFMVGGEIPAVPYLTRLDSFILTSTLLVFAALMQAVITSIMANRDRIKAALWVDRTCRILFPSAFAALTYYALYAPRLDIYLK
jgi:Neurotransmitter-gated ion-channel ligand binding domain/Neurotransmitter-gated ion-channel transmembrane region